MSARRAELLLLPYERTTSYLGGTSLGPAVLRPFIHPAPFASVSSVDMEERSIEEYLSRTSAAVARILRSGRAVAAVGGEHTVTWGVLSGYLEAGMRPAVIQLDAHADLRPEYEGTPWSHACVMRRVIERLDLDTLGVGIRSLSREEAVFAGKRSRTLVYAHQLRSGAGALREPLSRLGRDVYLTVDIDFFDPSAVPGTGTPEPGGPGWYRGLGIVEELLEGRNLVGFDLVELSPAVEEPVSVRAAAELMKFLHDRLPDGAGKE